MLQKTPRRILARRERSRRSRARRRAGTRIWQVQISDETMEGIIDALVSFGRLREGETDQGRIVEELGHQLAWFAEHWRSLRRCIVEG